MLQASIVRRIARNSTNFRQPSVIYKFCRHFRGIYDSSNIVYHHVVRKECVRMMAAYLDCDYLSFRRNWGDNCVMLCHKGEAAGIVSQEDVVQGMLLLSLTSKMSLILQDRTTLACLAPFPLETPCLSAPASIHSLHFIHHHDLFSTFFILQPQNVQAHPRIVAVGFQDFTQSKSLCRRRLLR